MILFSLNYVPKKYTEYLKHHIERQRNRKTSNVLNIKPLLLSQTNEQCSNNSQVSDIFRHLQTLGYSFHRFSPLYTDLGSVTPTRVLE